MKFHIKLSKRSENENKFDLAQLFSCRCGADYAFGRALINYKAAVMCAEHLL